MEHHSNLVPWQILSQEKDLQLEFISVSEKKPKFDPMLKAFYKGIDQTVFDINKDEKLSIEEQETDVQGKIDRSKKLVQDMKDKITPLVTKNSKYNNGRVFDLKGFSNNGTSLGADKDGFFCYTHRARSKSYEEPNKIPEKDINFIKSTG